jgi:hypothetical protein
LMAGNHPFLRGEWTGKGEQPEAMMLAKSGHWAGGSGSPLNAHPLAPSVDFLPDRIQRLFRRAFTDGARDPSARPSAAEWRSALQDLKVRDCARGHQLPVETEQCPWCRIDDERASRKAQRASAAAASQAQTIFKVGPASTPKPSFRSAPSNSYNSVPYVAPPRSVPVSSAGVFSGSGAKIAVGVAGIAVALIVLIAIITAVSNSGPNTTAISTTTSNTVTYDTTYTAPTKSSPPPDAVPCGDAAGNFAHAARGSDLTSCPFAMNVLAAVNNSGTSFPTVLQVSSPVTQQTYAMTCAYEQVLTCRGGNDAVVYVY